MREGAMNKPIAEDEFADKPLDPAVEKVRRKLVRFAVVNIGILFLALAAVVGALAWRTVSSAKAPSGPAVEAALLVPQGAQVLSQSIAPSEIALFLQGADGSRFVMVFDRANGRPLGRYGIVAQ